MKAVSKYKKSLLFKKVALKKTVLFEDRIVCPVITSLGDFLKHHSQDDKTVIYYDGSNIDKGFYLIKGRKRITLKGKTFEQLKRDTSLKDLSKKVYSELPPKLPPKVPEYHEVHDRQIFNGMVEKLKAYLDNVNFAVPEEPSIKGVTFCIDNQIGTSIQITLEFTSEEIDSVNALKSAQWSIRTFDPTKQKYKETPLRYFDSKNNLSDIFKFIYEKRRGTQEGFSEDLFDGFKLNLKTFLETNNKTG